MNRVICLKTMRGVFGGFQLSALKETVWIFPFPSTEIKWTNCKFFALSRPLAWGFLKPLLLESTLVVPHICCFSTTIFAAILGIILVVIIHPGDPAANPKNEFTTKPDAFKGDTIDAMFDLVRWACSFFHFPNYFYIAEPGRQIELYIVTS